MVADVGEFGLRVRGLEVGLYQTVDARNKNAFHDRNLGAFLFGLETVLVFLIPRFLLKSKKHRSNIWSLKVTVSQVQQRHITVISFT